MSEIKVSIVVAVYNTEQYLDRCLTSLVNQTLNDIEIICVNDASTDGSLKKLKEWEQKDHRIRVFSYDTNMRQGYARNLAIREARGEYIGICDSDDFVDANMYQTLIDHSNGMMTDLVVSNTYNIYNNNSKEVERVVNFMPQMTDLMDIKKYAVAYEATMCTNIIKRDFFINNNLFYPEKLLYEDNANGPIIYLKAGSINIVEQSFYNYCMNPQSTIHRKNDYKLFNRTITAKMFYDRAKEDDLYPELKDEIDYYFFVLFLYNTVLAALKSFDFLPYKKTKEVISEYLNIAGRSILKNRLFKSFVSGKSRMVLSYACLYERMEILMLISAVLWLKRKVS